MKFISYRLILLFFIIGLFFSYILGVQTKIVYIYPTLSNSSNVIFRDKAGQCFKFKSKKIDCPSDISKIKQIPIQ